MPSRADLLFWLAAATVAAKKPPFVPEQQLLCQLTPAAPARPKPPPRRWPRFNATGWGWEKRAEGGEKRNGKGEKKKKKTQNNKTTHPTLTTPPTPQPSAWHNYSRSLSMAALRMRVTRHGRASGCRSGDAAVPSGSGQGAVAPRSSVRPRGGTPGTLCPRGGGHTAPQSSGTEPGPASRWVCSFCSPSAFTPRARVGEFGLMVPGGWDLYGYLFKNGGKP